MASEETSHADDRTVARMTVEGYLAWLDAQPGQKRYELVAGEPVAMAPERAGNARLKARLWQALAAAIAARGLPCEAFPDGMAVQIDADTVYEPDALVRCGPRLPDEAVLVHDPVIVVEVLSRSTAGRDAGAKLDDHFRLLGLVHYLLVKTERPCVIHHRRGDGDGDGDAITTRIVTAGTIDLDPPGIALDVDRLYA